MAIVESVRDSNNSVQNGRGYIDSLVNNYIIKPRHARGINGFIFDYEGETNLQLQAEITDHYSENNVAIQDHIAIRPVRITLRGYQGELVKFADTGVIGLLNTIQNKLTTVPAYLGKYTPQQLAKVQAAVSKAQDTVNKIDTALARVNNLVGMLPGIKPGITKQHQAFNFLRSMMFSKQVFIVDTPYGVLNNMVIESLVFIQPEETSSMSDISVTLKQMRFVEVQTTTINNKAGRAVQQSQSPTDKGKTGGVPIASSILYQIGHK